MVYVTHDQVEAMTLADRIVVMNGGRIEQVGSPLELYEQPSSMFVAGFIGSPAMNFLKGRISGVEHGRAQVDLALGPRIEVAVKDGAVTGSEVALGIRPEHIRLATPGDPGSHTGPAFMVEMLGSDTFVHLREGEESIVVRDSLARHVRMDDSVTISLPPSACYLFDRNGMRLSADRDWTRRIAHP
jgi:multiple sugar transport system ATP-binding protein